MLIIDGVKYHEWIPRAEDELEQMVKEHAQDIFGEQSIYLDRKQKLKSLSGIGSIPDGYVIIFGDSPQWHIVEIELSSHPLYEHIVSQVGRFINGISNPNTQRGIVNAIDAEIRRDDFLTLRLRKAIESTETYKFLSDLISKQPILTIIIEKDTQELREALSTLRYPQIKVVEFKTFVREGVGLGVHAHIFEPPIQPLIKKIVVSDTRKEEILDTHQVEGRTTIDNLIDARMLKFGQAIYGWHKGKKYEARILPDGIRLPDGRKFSSLSMAAFRGIVGHQVNGWNWWHTTKEDGTECLLSELREEYRATHPSNP